MGVRLAAVDGNTKEAEACQDMEATGVFIDSSYTGLVRVFHSSVSQLRTDIRKPEEGCVLPKIKTCCSMSADTKERHVQAGC